MAATKRNFILPSGIGISADNIYTANSANSTSLGTGSIISLGGAGIAKSLSIGGYLQLFNGSNYTSFVSSASGNTIYTLPSTSPATGSSVLQSTSSGVMSWVPMTATGAASGFTTLNGLTAEIQYFATGTSGNVFNISSSGSTHTFNIPIAGSGSTGLISTQTQTIAGAKTFSSDLSVSSTTASTNSTTGALVVTGGVGIGDSLFVAGNISVNTGTNGLLFRKLVAGNYGAIYSTNVTPSATNYTMITDGASVNFNGTNGVYFNINNTNKIQVTANNINIVPTANSNSTSTGAFTVAGGVGIGGSLYVASATAISGVTINNGIITGNLTGTATTAGFATTSSIANSWTTPRVLTLGGDLTGNVTWSGSGDTTLTATIAANSVALGTDTTGQYASTLAVSGSGITVTSSAVDDATAYTIYSSATANNAASSIVLRDGSGNFSAGNITASLSGTATTAQNINVVNSVTNSSHPVLISPNAVGSGIAVSSNTTLSYNPSTLVLSSSGLAVTSGTASTNASTGSLTVSGGVGIGGSLFAGTSIAVDTGVFGLSLQRASGGSFGAIYSTGVTPSSSNYSFATDGTNLNLNSTSNVYLNISNTVKATISTNNINIGINVASISTSTGAFTVTGGVGIGGSLYVGGASSLSGVSFNVGAIGATSSTNSTSSSTGALIVTGGVGIGQSASIGGRLQLFSGSNYTAFVSSASGNTVYTLPATSPATGSSVLQSTSSGVMSWVPMTASSSSGNTSQNVVINSAGSANVFHPVLFTPSSSSAGSAVSSDSTITFNPSTEILNVSGLAITSGTASTNTTTGALVVRGGLGVTGQLSFATASFGYTGITSNPTMSFIGNTSSSPITLTVLTDNSLSWEGSSGQLFSIDNNLTSGDIFSVSDISGLPIINASAGQTVSINEFGGYTRIGNGSISSTGASSSAADGSLVVYGGVGITGDVSIGGKLQLFNGTRYAAFVSSSTGNTIYTLPATSPATGTSILQATSAGVMSWISPLGVGVSVGGSLDGSVQYKSGSGLGGTRSFFFNTTNYGLRLGNFPGEEITTSNSAALLIEQSIGSFNGSTNGTLIAANASTGFAGDLINLQVNANTKFRVSAAGAIGFSSGITAGGDVVVNSPTAATNSTSGALQIAGGAGIAKTLFVGGNLSFAGYMNGGSNTFTKNPGAGDISLDNGTADTPAVLHYWQNSKNFGTDVFFSGSGVTRYRIVKELNETGGAELWSIDREGIVYRSAYAVGETINTAMYNYSDLGMSATTTISSTSYTTFATISYTPKSSSSYLWIEFSATYTVAGTSADDHWSNIEVNGSEIVNANQVWANATGGGTRSGVLFPLAARYTNTGTSSLTITVRAKKGTSDDNNTIYGNNASGYMRIQEIGR